MARLPVARPRAEPIERQVEDAAGEPVVDDGDQQTGDEQPDRDDDPLPGRIVGEVGRLRRQQRQRQAHEERDRRDHVLTVLGCLARVVAQLREDLPRGLGDEERPQPPFGGFVAARGLGLRVHGRSVCNRVQVNARSCR